MLIQLYAALEHQIRKNLKEKNQFFMDMKNKPGQKPTARWVFQRFIGISEARLGSSPPVLTDIKAHHKVIIDVMGERYRRIYS